MAEFNDHTPAVSQIRVAYEAPALVEYGTVEEWTLGHLGSGIIISIVL